MIETSDVLTGEARAFFADLQREFGARRVELLARRAERLERLHAGELPDLLPETAAIRAGDWRVAPTPAEIALALKAAISPTKPSLRENCSCHSASAAEPATIEPASM